MTPIDANASSPSTASDVPTACPACASPDIVTTSKVADASSYFRCKACGYIWNALRWQGNRHRYRR